MANQTQKQKAAAARAAKAAEEAALKEQQAAQSGEGDMSDPVETQPAAEDKKEEVSENETETKTAEDEQQQPDPAEGQGESEESDEAPKEVEAVAFTKGEVSEVQGTEIKVQPRAGLDNTVPAPEFGKVDTKELVKQIEKDQQAVTPPPAPAIAKSSLSMKRVDVQTNDVNIETISTEDYFQMKHQYVFGTGSNDLQEVIEFLNRYEDTMARGAVVDERVGISLQHQLYRNYLRAVTLNGNERNIAMDYILWKFFKNEKSAYRPHYLGRFTRSGKWEIDELKMFNSLNTIFHAISHPLERVLVLREYKLGAIVSKFPQDKARYTEAFLGWTQTYR